MLPFPQLVKYSNIVQPTWYTGNEIVAYDSLIFSSSGFTDYTGKTMRVGNTVYNVTGNSYPSIGSEVMPYGHGINLNQGVISTYFPGAVGIFRDSWCLDFYIKQNTTVTGGTACCPVNFVNENIATASSGGRLELNHLNVTSVAQDSSTASYNGSISSQIYISTSFYHYAIQYFNNKFYIFKNGILIENFDFIIVGINWKDLAIFGNLYRGNPASTYAIIERYRLRSGQYFDISGFDPETIYPGTRIS